MNQKLTSSLILLFLLMNIFFEFSVSHHTNIHDKMTVHSHSGIQPDHHTKDIQQSEDMDNCSSGTCHSGYCKLLNLNPISYKIGILSHIEYSISLLYLPDSPYLMGNRRPPKLV